MDINAQMKMTMGAKAQPMPINMEMKMTMTQKVQTVASDGTATLLDTVDSQTGTANGQPIPETPALKKPIIQKMTQRGTIVGKPSAGGAALPMVGMNPVQMSQLVALPAGSVHVGSSWSSDSGMGSVTNKIVSINGPIAVISSDGNIDMGKAMSGMGGMFKSMKMSGTMQMHMVWRFNAAAGYPAGMTGNIQYQMQMSAGQQGAMNMAGKMKMSLTSL